MRTGLAARLGTAALLGAALAFAGTTRAAPRDEVRVYTDSIEGRGKWGLELHFNSMPRPRISTVIPGEPRPASGLVVTPELSYGLSDAVEIEFGFMLPSVRLDDGSSLQVVPHARIKWMPRRAQPQGAQGDWFWGSVLEWSPSPYRRGVSNEDAASHLALRPIIGWRDARWLVAANLLLEWPLGLRNPAASDVRRPEVAPSLKLLRSYSDRFATGLEYHGEWGSARRLLPSGEQAHTLYWIVERRTPFWMSFGIGHGLNRNAGGLSIKGSLEIPLD